MCVGVCLLPAFILKQGIGMCDCLYTGALLDLCHVLLIVLLGDLCPLVFFHPVVFPCGSLTLFFFQGTCGAGALQDTGKAFC